MTQKLQYFLLVLIIAGLQACTITGSSLPADKKIILTEKQTSPAVVSLVRKARNASKRGELTRAESYLERALRLEPNNPVLWNYLAKIKLKRKKYTDAEDMASRSNSLLTGNPVLQSDNWRIIAHARQGKGDELGAKEAQKQADAILKKAE